MIITISLEFRAKVNPAADDPAPLEATTGFDSILPASEAADYLEQLAIASRERRVFGFMMQEVAEVRVGAREWVDLTLEDLLAQDGATKESNEDTGETNGR